MSTNQDTTQNSNSGQKKNEPENSNVTPINVMNQKPNTKQSDKADANAVPSSSQKTPSQSTKKPTQKPKKKANSSQKAPTKKAAKTTNITNTKSEAAPKSAPFDSKTMLAMTSKKSREFNYEWVQSFSNIVDTNFNHINTMMEFCNETYDLTVENQKSISNTVNKSCELASEYHNKIVQQASIPTKKELPTNTLRENCSDGISMLQDLISSTMDTFIGLSTELNNNNSKYIKQNQERWFKLSPIE